MEKIINKFKNLKFQIMSDIKNYSTDFEWEKTGALDGWMDGKAGIRIAYRNKKFAKTVVLITYM